MSIHRHRPAIPPRSGLAMWLLLAVTVAAAATAAAQQPFRERSEHCTRWDEKRRLCTRCEVPLDSVEGNERSKPKELACASMLPGEDIEISVSGKLNVAGASADADSWIEVKLLSRDDNATWANLANVGNCPCSGSRGQRQIDSGMLSLSTVVPLDGVARASVSFGKCSHSKTDRPTSTCRFRNAHMIFEAGLD